MTTRPRLHSRDPATYAVAALVPAAACLWGSSRMTWVLVFSADGLGPARMDRLLGSVWFGALTPLALVLLTAIAAVLATYGKRRRVCGVVITLVAGVAAVPALSLLTHPGLTTRRAAALLQLPARARVTAVRCVPFPVTLVLLAAVLAFGAGVVLAGRSAASGLSSRYRTPVERRTRAVQHYKDTGVSERVLWDAIDAGKDPTSEFEGTE